MQPAASEGDLKESELVHIISQKLGRECVETSEQIDAKICFRMDESGRVIRLSANRCNLMNETIPPEMWELKHIRTLYLRSNMLSFIPEGLFSLKSLRSLSLSKLHLNRFPDRLGNLPKLERLYLDSTKFPR